MTEEVMGKEVRAYLSRSDAERLVNALLTTLKRDDVADEIGFVINPTERSFYFVGVEGDDEHDSYFDEVKIHVD